MLCSRFKQILFTKTTSRKNAQLRCFINVRFISKRYGVDGFWASLNKHRKELHRMSSVRFIIRNIGLNRLWSAWTRSAIIGHVVKRCRKDRGVREVIHCFRQAVLRPRRSLLLYATAACQAKGNEDEPEKPKTCSQGISDEDLENLLTDLDGVDELIKKTLYCLKCGKRIVIEKKQPGVKYCLCKEPHLPEPSLDGWMPYMEAEDVIIWRKEYKPGQGLYAYKVYGLYKDVHAHDYAAVNVDGAYRQLWDSAVAALSVVERNWKGLVDQTVLHWEVLWPRLFANRDYVYVRRHKEFSVKSVTSPRLFDDTIPTPVPSTLLEPPARSTRPCVHDNAKKKSMVVYSKEAPQDEKTNKVYVILSRSCVHPEVPETRNAIRVSEYWSQMVVKSLDGEDKIGMEFVLTYYDEPAVGGMPSGVTTWATGRAAPVYLQRMRLAAKEYADYKKGLKEDIPETTFNPETKKVPCEEAKDTVKEEDMESSKTGPDMENGMILNKATQTDETHPPAEGEGDEVKVDEAKVAEKVKVTENKSTSTEDYEEDFNEEPTRPPSVKDDCEKVPDISDDVENVNNGGWWRFLYPFYYFV